MPQSQAFLRSLLCEYSVIFHTNHFSQLRLNYPFLSWLVLSTKVVIVFSFLESSNWRHNLKSTTKETSFSSRNYHTHQSPFTRFSTLHFSQQLLLTSLPLRDLTGRWYNVWKNQHKLHKSIPHASPILLSKMPDAAMNMFLDNGNITKPFDEVYRNFFNRLICTFPTNKTMYVLLKTWSNFDYKGADIEKGLCLDMIWRNWNSHMHKLLLHIYSQPPSTLHQPDTYRADHSPSEISGGEKEIFIFFIKHIVHIRIYPLCSRSITKMLLLLIYQSNFYLVYF